MTRAVQSGMSLSTTPDVQLAHVSCLESRDENLHTRDPQPESAPYYPPYTQTVNNSLQHLQYTSQGSPGTTGFSGNADHNEVSPPAATTETTTIRAWRKPSRYSRRRATDTNRPLAPSPPVAGSFYAGPLNMNSMGPVPGLSTIPPAQGAPSEMSLGAHRGAYLRVPPLSPPNSIYRILPPELANASLSQGSPSQRTSNASNFDIADPSPLPLPRSAYRPRSPRTGSVAGLYQHPTVEPSALDGPRVPIPRLISTRTMHNTPSLSRAIPAASETTRTREEQKCKSSRIIRKPSTRMSSALSSSPSQATAGLGTSMAPAEGSNSSHPRATRKQPKRACLKSPVTSVAGPSRSNPPNRSTRQTAVRCSQQQLLAQLGPSQSAQKRKHDSDSDEDSEEHDGEDDESDDSDDSDSEDDGGEQQRKKPRKLGLTYINRLFYANNPRPATIRCRFPTKEDPNVPCNVHVKRTAKGVYNHLKYTHEWTEEPRICTWIDEVTGLPCGWYKGIPGSTADRFSRHCHENQVSHFRATKMCIVCHTELTLRRPNKEPHKCPERALKKRRLAEEQERKNVK